MIRQCFAGLCPFCMWNGSALSALFVSGLSGLPIGTGQTDETGQRERTKMTFEQKGVGCADGWRRSSSPHFGVLGSESYLTEDDDRGGSVQTGINWGCQLGGQRVVNYIDNPCILSRCSTLAPLI